MSAITGIINAKEKIGKKTENIYCVYNMLQSVRHRGPDYTGAYIEDYALMGQAGLSTAEDALQECSVKLSIGGREYAIVLDGILFNRDKLDFEIAKSGLRQAESDAEAILLLYYARGVECVKELSGNFAFVIYDKENRQFILARDHLGIKALFYARKWDSLIFSSEIKGLFAAGINKEISEVGYAEIFGLAPCRTAGECIYKGIGELLPAEYAIFSADGLKRREYWRLEAREHKDSAEDTVEKVRALVLDSIESQVTPEGCALLSGGLDSSIIAAVAAKKLEQSGDRLSTFSIDYEGNDKYFERTAYQPDSDAAFILLMSDYCKSIHQSYIADSGAKLAQSVIEAAFARDLPGMADVDGSLLLFCKEIARSHKVALSGECADEIFCGYPWYMKNESLSTFPWMKQDNIRSYILKDDFKKKYKIDQYVQERFAEAAAKAPLPDNADERTARFRRLQYLNLYWFMATLLERSNAMSMFSHLEVRVPFCTPDIAQYVYNIPPEILLLGNREKGMLRKAVSGELPEAVINRKKSPYPKTFNPKYEAVIKEMLKETLKKDSILKDAVDMEKLKILMSSPSDYGLPWFGQLMAAPQLYGHLLQIHCLFDNA
ncbi:MAG: asparagine synthase (glutamine-hydrolyzing) [Christensenellales bacterium]|jgi:asparagine synthase (glutamine-hydrolysing)